MYTEDMDSIAILGRQPALGLAELESLYGAAAVNAVGAIAARIAVDPCVIDFRRLGGTLKLCKLLTEFDGTHWREIEQFLVRVAPDHAAKMPAGKMHLGLSVYGTSIASAQLLATGLKIKKAVQHNSGRSVRMVPTKTTTLNAAQVIHHRLTGPNGWELVFVQDGSRLLLAQTVAVQDIDAYAARDFNRPKRDAKVGMLPPKLAQTLINLATGPEEFAAIRPVLSSGICLSEAATAEMRAARAKVRLLDPFCGSGVILQEAALMGYTPYGTDVDQRMVDYTRTNLAWLAEHYPAVTLQPPALAVADATTAQWQPPIAMVASETYLGRPFTTAPDPETLARTMADCNLILKKFLQNIHPQLTPGTRLCLAVPAWQTKPGTFRFLPLIDQITPLGYNQVRFERARAAELLYYRPDQFVARQLLVITRI